MSEPINPVALGRIRRLLDMIEAGDPHAQVAIYASESYVSIEVRSRNLPERDVRAVFGSASLDRSAPVQSEDEPASVS